MGFLERLTAGWRGIQNNREFRAWDGDNRGATGVTGPTMPAAPAWLDPRAAGDVQRPRSVDANARMSPSAYNDAAGFLGARPAQAPLPDELTADFEPWRQTAPEQIGERVTPLEVGGAAHEGGLEPESAPNAPSIDLSAIWHDAYRRAVGPGAAPPSGDFADVRSDLARQGGLLSRLRRNEMVEMRRRWQ